MGKSTNSLQGLNHNVLLGYKLMGIVHMLPLTATTLICHNATGPNAMGRGFQQFLEFAIGILGLDP
jgi:hypothetical protein